MKPRTASAVATQVETVRTAKLSVDLLPAMPVWRRNPPHDVETELGAQ